MSTWSSAVDECPELDASARFSNVNAESAVFAGPRMRLLIGLLVAGALAVGAAQAWTARLFLNADGVSYLDISDRLLAGDVSAAVNGLWNPLYPVLLAVVRGLLGDVDEVQAAHLLNYVLFGLTLWAFRFFVEGVLQARYPQAEGLRMSDDDVRILAYGVFIWATVDLIQLSKLSPDMLVACAIYAAWGASVRIDCAPSRMILPIGAGLAFGIGYWAKAAMFPISLLCFALLLARSVREKRSPRGTVLAGTVFVLVASPLVCALSLQKGRITFSEGGLINYAWHVTGVPDTHWQGGVEGAGSPLHSTRKLLDYPAIYEFDGPVPGTYPPGYDPSYWYEGVEIPFSLVRQLVAIGSSLKTVSEVVVGWRGGFIVPAILLGLLMIAVWCGPRGFRMHVNWPILLTSLGAIAMYVLVHVETRYISPFVSAVILCLLAGVSIDNSPAARRLLRAFVITVAAALLLQITLSTVRTSVLAFGGKVSSGARGRTPAAHYEIARALTEAGLRPGNRIVHLGDSWSAVWARIAKIRIVAEVMPNEVIAFWVVLATDPARIWRALESTGANAVITDCPPDWAPLAGWRPLASTGLHIRFLEAPPQPSGNRHEN